MNWKLHLTLGTVSGIAGGLCLLSNPAWAAGYTITCTISSLFSDLDSPMSKLGRTTPMISKFCNNAFWMMYGFSVGFLCHMIQDLFTNGGIKLLYPFSKKRFHLTNFKSKSKIHNCITVPLIILSVFIVPKMTIYIMNFF
jgi:membrane-bound metal-dependent hydrolase YbcI (DUF457 family)